MPWRVEVSPYLAPPRALTLKGREDLRAVRLETGRRVGPERLNRARIWPQVCYTRNGCGPCVE